jgi:hypothetical protein
VFLLLDVSFDLRHVYCQSFVVPHADCVKQKRTILLRVPSLEALEVLVSDYEPLNVVEVKRTWPILGWNNPIDFNCLYFNLLELWPRTAAT